MKCVIFFLKKIITWLGDKIYVCMCVCVCVCMLCLVFQPYSTLCHPMGYNPPGSSVHGDSTGRNTGVGFHALLQRIFPIQGLNLGLLYYRQILSHLSHKESYIYFKYISVYIYIWKWKSPSCIWPFATPWTIPSMEVSRPEYWRGLPFPSPGDLTTPGIKPRSPTLQVDSLPAESQGKPKKTWVSSLSLLQGISPTQESSPTEPPCVCVCVCVCVCIYI